MTDADDVRRLAPALPHVVDSGQFPVALTTACRH